MSSEYLNNKLLENIIRRFQKSKQDKIRFELIIDDIKTSNDKRCRQNKKSPHDLNSYLTEQSAAEIEFLQSQKDLAEAFYTLSEHLVRYAKDIIVDCDDATQEGVMICFEKIDRFNPQKGKAFNYMTTCVLNHLRQMYRTSKNYKLLKERYRDFLSYRLGNVIICNGKERYL